MQLFQPSNEVEVNRIFTNIFNGHVSYNTNPVLLQLENYNEDDYWKHMKDNFGHDRKRN